MRLLAIDPSLRCTGFAVLERRDGNKIRALEYGTIPNAPKLLPSSCLVAIHDRLAEVAFEAIIYVQSHRTAITLGAARGAALLAAAQRGLAVYEYAPKDVKQAVVGRGGADKAQVAFMVRALLGLTETPASDAADALAIGLTHFRAHDAQARGITTLNRI
jgi:crossover junction endodeoxyribonuclease RuvC